MKNRKHIKPYWEMNTDELAKATKKFDKEFVADSFRPMTATERTRWQRIKRKPGRPQVGNGHKIICVSIEKSLLKQSDALAKKLGISRASLIASCLRHELGV